MKLLKEIQLLNKIGATKIHHYDNNPLVGKKGKETGKREK